MAGIKRQACDVWFSKAVRHRDGHSCQRCGKGPNTEAAHIYGRANKAVRWDMDNAIALCHWCHKHYTANPILFHDDLRSKFGDGFMDLLREKANAVLKTNKALRLEISAHYREEVRSAEADPAYRIVNWGC